MSFLGFTGLAVPARLPRPVAVINLGAHMWFEPDRRVGRRTPERDALCDT